MDFRVSESLFFIWPRQGTIRNLSMSRYPFSGLKNCGGWSVRQERIAGIVADIL